MAALGAVAALSMASASQAAAVDCAGAAYDQCFAGLLTQPARSPSFEDLSIGRLSLAGLSDVVGDFVTAGLDFTEVSLWKNGVAVATDSKLDDGISFDNILQGRYNVRVSGLVGDFSFGKNKVGGFYAGGFTVTQVPEPETYALFGAGLLAVFFMSRRRNHNS
jgi:PEP-CTERM motif